VICDCSIEAQTKALLRATLAQVEPQLPRRSGRCPRPDRAIWPRDLAVAYA